MGVSPAVVKLGACAVLLCLGAGGAALPAYCGMDAHPALVARANAFAAGVFLSLALVHLLPEAAEGLSQYAAWHATSVAVLMGFFAILALEALLGGSGPDGATPLPTITTAAAKGTHDDSSVEMRDGGDPDNDGNSSSEDGLMTSMATAPRSTGSALTSLVLAGTLAFHSALEGMTIGLEPTASGAALIAAGIGLHKGVAGVALGVRLVAANLPCSVVAVCLAFGASTPLGVLAGWAAEADLPPAAAAVFKAASAGTFLFIGAVELVPPIIHNPTATRRGKAVDICAALAGTAAVYLMSVFLDFD